jgi:hypothetical protein
MNVSKKSKLLIVWNGRSTFIWLSELMHGGIHILYVSLILFGDMYFFRLFHSDIKLRLDYYC